MDKKIKTGLVGFGCVGQALYEIINAESLPFDVSRICVKNPGKARSLSEENFTYRYEELVNDPEIEVIVELIDDSEAAFKMVKQGLVAGKKVVTANKKMVAEHLEELMALKENGGKLWYEAAVCGGIPIVMTMDQFYNYEPIQEISGIFNGSSNFILTKIEQEGLDYHQALALAQKLGFAESNPLLDVGGYDTMNKLVILLCHAYGITTTPSSLSTIGIQHIASNDLDFARQRGLKIKLIAKAVRNNNLVHAYVMPCFVDANQDLGHVNNEFNAVLIKGKYTDEHLFTGKGAGGAPTAASVIADIYATIGKPDYDYYKWHDNREITYSNKVSLPVYLRYNHSAELNEFGFEHIWSEGRYKNGGFVVGEISLDNLWSLNAYIEQKGIVVVAASLLENPQRLFATKDQQTVAV
ncbi:MAG: homoserine dehydrogenase [Cyclobacteriaceae bacterium]|nr:MAG: homoserine dehydrogenase [Cyclobacteriaceae bacterium]